MSCHINSTDTIRVIVFGMGDTLALSLDYIKNRFVIIGCSDSQESKKNSEYTKQVPFYRINDLHMLQFDYILITSIYDDEIYNDLTSHYSIQGEKVLRRIDWYRMLFQKSYGEENKSLRFYIISRPIRTRNGLMSYLFTVLQQLGEIEGKGFLPVVDMMNYHNQYLEEQDIGQINSWELYYEQLTNVKLNSVYRSQNVILGYDDPNYLDHYEEKYDLPLMHEMYRKYIKLQPEVKTYVQREYEKILGKYKKPLGVLLRGSDMNSLKLKNHPIQPSVDEVIGFIEANMNEWGCDIIYLCTEDADIAFQMKSWFGERLVYTNQLRFSNTGNEWLADIVSNRQNDKYLRGLEYLTAIALLAKCDNLIAGLCCGSVCAQIIHGMDYENIKILDRGVY